MRAWERKLLRLIGSHLDDENYIRCIEKLCSEYSVSYEQVNNFLQVVAEGAKQLAHNDGL